MSSARRQILDWFGRGAIAPARVVDVLRIAGVFPSGTRWERFLDRLLLWLGSCLLLSGLTTFFAANWSQIGRIGHFLLVDMLILAALAIAWLRGVGSTTGRVALFAASILVGVLLAVIGQTYQTGADTYELFAAWALMILPWTLLGRFTPLWLLWFGLTNLAVYLYYTTFNGLLGWVSGPREMLWVFLGLNTFALAAWEYAMSYVGDRQASRIVPRILTVLGGIPATMLAVQAVTGTAADKSVTGLPVWLLWTTAAFVFYRYLRTELFVLAGLLLSFVIVVIAGLMRLFLGDTGEAISLFLIAMVVLGISSAGGWWLTHLANRPSA